MFIVGDRVIYTATYHIASKKYKNKKGTVMYVESIPRSIPEEQVFRILFDFDLDDDRGTRSMYLANLIPANETPDWEI
jgi:hypothetical protein